MEQIQFIGTTPDTLRASFIEDVKTELEKITKQFQPKEPTEFLTRQEVADLLKVDVTTVHNWTKRGKLKKYGIGNKVFYKRTEVESAIQPLKG